MPVFDCNNNVIVMKECLCLAYSCCCCSLRLCASESWIHSSTTENATLIVINIYVKKHYFLKSEVVSFGSQERLFVPIWMQPITTHWFLSRIQCVLTGTEVKRLFIFAASFTAAVGQNCDIEVWKWLQGVYAWAFTHFTMGKHAKRTMVLKL